MTKPKFSFGMVGISPGETLHHRDDVSCTCKVLSDTMVELEGTEMSLSRSAQILRERLGIIRGEKVQGPRMWMYKGKSLEDLRSLAGH